MDLNVRPASEDDCEAIASIYNEGIDDRIATFET
ncbi:MAG: N-acetyltransferase, partial [Chloroflexia bacterium]|nr:N-acetyltransferase [Chloroflexia bacterium]